MTDENEYVHQLEAQVAALQAQVRRLQFTIMGRKDVLHDASRCMESVVGAVDDAVKRLDALEPGDMDVE